MKGWAKILNYLHPFTFQRELCVKKWIIVDIEFHGNNVFWTHALPVSKPTTRFIFQIHIINLDDFMTSTSKTYLKSRQSEVASLTFFLEKWILHGLLLRVINVTRWRFKCQQNTLVPHNKGVVLFATSIGSTSITYPVNPPASNGWCIVSSG